MTWPHPGDSPIVIARRVAWAYRARLDLVAPEDCAQIDRRLILAGQHWAVPRNITRAPDEWLDAADAAELAGTSLSNLRKLRQAKRLTGRRLSDRRWQYQVAEILALSATPRKRSAP